MSSKKTGKAGRSSEIHLKLSADNPINVPLIDFIDQRISNSRRKRLPLLTVQVSLFYKGKRLCSENGSGVQWGMCRVVQIENEEECEDRS